MIILVLCVAGFILAAYAMHIEVRIKKDSRYKPICDISDSISCSKTITSPYGKIFVVSNSVLGMVFYASVILFHLIGMHTLVYYSAWAAIGASVVFAYILAAKVRTFCLLCIAVYVVNGLLLVAVLRGW